MKRMTDQEAQAKVGTLAKWAQEYIARLERKVVDAERVAEDARLATNPDDTNTVIDPYQDTIGLPSSGRVRFILTNARSARQSPDQRRHDQWIDVHVDHGGTHIELMASETIRVTPQASNVLYVEASRV
jgi:hypothetical protein